MGRRQIGFEAELAGRKLFLSLLLASLIVLVGCLVAPTYAVRPTISSRWTSNPPTIDGRFTLGEWFNLQITIQGPSFPDTYVKPTFVYFMNDNSRLYVLVDASGDGTDNSLDECLLVFGFPPPNNVKVEIIGASGARVTVNFDAAVGFDSSPNNQTAHKIYEFSIPFSYINAQPGQPLDFSSPLSGKHLSMPYDATTFRDNVWPVGLIESDISTYGTLGVGSPPIPVGGYMEPVNKLAIVTPYVALFGLVATVAVVIVKPWKKPEN